MAKFAVQTGYGVTIYPPNHPAIRIHSDQPYETDDKEIADIIRSQPGVIEVKEAKSPAVKPKQTKAAKPSKK